MSVLIKGMEMPRNCRECGLYIDGACYAKGYRDYRSIMDMSKPDDCPLIELPPHGRLIDADAIQDYNVETFGQRLLIIDSAPTVIEAEDGTDA